MWRPPASLGALDAFASAASSEAPAVRGAAALELLTGASAVSVVTFTNRAFWRAQLGDRELADMLAELAVFLEVPVAILDWPALVVADRDRGAIVEAWEERVAASQGIRPALSVLHPVRVAKEVLADVCSALTAGSATVESSNTPVEGEGGVPRFPPPLPPPPQAASKRDDAQSARHFVRHINTPLKKCLKGR